MYIKCNYIYIYTYICLFYLYTYICAFDPSTRQIDPSTRIFFKMARWRVKSARPRVWPSCPLQPEQPCGLKWSSHGISYMAEWLCFWCCHLRKNMKDLLRFWSLQNLRKSCRIASVWRYQVQKLRKSSRIALFSSLQIADWQIDR